jgi:large subunit ribosomal protein L10
LEKREVNREEKAELLSEMNAIIAASGSVVISHYRGLTVAEMEELRKKAREYGAKLRVTKNRITRLALKGTSFEGLDELFKGPTIMAYAEDPISACKLCVEYAKANEKFVVVGGALTTGVLTQAEIERLATIPSMDELRAKIIGLLQAPGAALARVTKAYSEKAAA